MKLQRVTTPGAINIGLAKEIGSTEASVLKPEKNIAISFLINAHREGAVLIPAIRSAKAAAEICKKQNISVEIILVGDNVDILTEKVISQNIATFDICDFVTYGNLGDSRRHGISLSSGEFLCFLDGDDVWQDTWPASAYLYALSTQYLNTIYHTEVFAGFGSVNFFRLQIRTTDAIFHPLHLSTTWHFCNNLFAHRSIFVRIPIESYNHDEGYGSEDWHWSCETLAHGLARDYVPETVYFYRIDSSKPGLGTLKGLVLKPAAIFQQPELLLSYPQFLGVSHEVTLDEINSQNLRYEHDPQPWLYRELCKAAEIDYSIHGLLKNSSEMVCETPELSSASALALAAVGDFCGDQFFDLFSIDCETADIHLSTLIMHGLRGEASRGKKIVVLCGNKISKSRLTKRDGNILYVNYKMLISAHADIAYFADQWLGNFLSNFRPRCIINLNAEFVDLFSGTYRKFLRNSGIRVARILMTKLQDIGESYWDRRILGKIQQCDYFYSELWTRDKESQSYLEYLYLGTDIVIGSTEKKEYDAIFCTILNNFSFSNAKKKNASDNSVVQTLRVKNVDVSCVLNVHREGLVLIPTLRSISRMLQHSKKRSISCELIIVLDNSDIDTENVISAIIADEMALTGATILRVVHKELGRSRRSGVQAAHGQYVAFLDADDLYSANWITEALRMCRASPEIDVVCHPEINVYFGKERRLHWHADEVQHEAVPYSGLLLENYWTSLSFSKKEVYLAQPVADNDIEHGFGYEDWHWNMEAIARGVVHRAVPSTCHFIRLKAGDSLNKASSARGVITRPSSFTHKLLWGELKKPRLSGARKIAVKDT